MRKIAVVLMLVSAAAYADTEVSYGTPVVRGSYDAKAIETAVKDSAPTKAALVACAEKAKLAAKATAQVTLTIAADGKLATSATGSQNAELDNCVAAAFASLAFAKPKDGKPAAAVVPVTLAPKAAVAKDEVPPPENTGTTGIGALGQPKGSGYGVGSDGARSSYKPPQVKIGEPKVKGELDKAIVRRYIKRNIQKLVYCYEKELLAKPKLKGTVTASFVIGAEGKVTSSKATGLKDGAAVEQCYGRVIEMIEFPKPKSGEVTVSYPFTLKPN